MRLRYKILFFEIETNSFASIHKQKVTTHSKNITKKRDSLHCTTCKETANDRERSLNQAATIKDAGM